MFKKNERAEPKPLALVKLSELERDVHEHLAPLLCSLQVADYLPSLLARPMPPRGSRAAPPGLFALPPPAQSRVSAAPLHGSVQVAPSRWCQGAGKEKCLYRVAPKKEARPRPISARSRPISSPHTPLPQKKSKPDR